MDSPGVFYPSICMGDPRDRIGKLYRPTRVARTMYSVRLKVSLFISSPGAG